VHTHSCNWIGLDWIGLDWIGCLIRRGVCGLYFFPYRLTFLAFLLPFHSFGVCASYAHQMKTRNILKVNWNFLHELNHSGDMTKKFVDNGYSGEFFLSYHMIEERKKVDGRCSTQYDRE
jgi:hypothetical protein